MVDGDGSNNITSHTSQSEQEMMGWNIPSGVVTVSKRNENEELNTRVKTPICVHRPDRRSYTKDAQAF